MRKIIYLSLLLFIPFLLSAGHGRDRLNGKWISPYFHKEIKVKVKRNYVKVKGLSRRGWIEFVPVGRRTFEDCEGNRLRIRNIHDLTYTNRYTRERIKFVKKGHRHHNHVCGRGCDIGDDFFIYNEYGNSGYYDDDYGYYEGDDFYDDRYGDGRRKRDRNRGVRNDRRIDGKYFVREIDDYVELRSTNNGLKAKRGGGDWVHYNRNRYRKNEYRDSNNNKYIISNGNIKWKSRDESIVLNLGRAR